MRENDLALLCERLRQIRQMGWIENRRPGNAGGVGNTLEDLLEIAENNLRLPDFGEWEIKSRRISTSSLMTLFHSEPMPRGVCFVPQIFLPLYGWPHQEAGTKYPITERSFRQTINTLAPSERGFFVVVDRRTQRVYIQFDFNRIGSRHAEWRQFVLNGVGTRDVTPNPYWSFEELDHTLHTKLANLMFVEAENMHKGGIEFFKYNHFEAFVNPTLEAFLELMDQGYIYVDFDARTGHNHGTKFRIRANQRKNLYNTYIEV